MATSSLPWMGKTTCRTLERKALRSPPARWSRDWERSYRPDSNLLGLLGGLSAIPPPRGNRMVAVDVVRRCLRWRVLVVVVVSVAVAWHMGEYVATSSSAIVVVVKRGTMALVLLMGSVREIIVGFGAAITRQVKLMRQNSIQRLVTMTGDGRTKNMVGCIPMTHERGRILLTRSTGTCMSKMSCQNPSQRMEQRHQAIQKENPASLVPMIAKKDPLINQTTQPKPNQTPTNHNANQSN